MKNKALNYTLMLVTLLYLLPLSLLAQKDRSEIADKYKWDLTPLFASDEEWEKKKNELVTELAKVESFKGTLMQSASNLLACLEYSSKVSKEATKLYIYSSMHGDLDTRDMKYSSMEKELQQIFSDFSAKAAYINPEILKSEWSVVEKFLKEEPRLEVYRKDLNDLFREKAHTLSEPEERIMALAGLISDNSQSVYSTFSNAEMPYPEVTLSNGEKVTLNSSGYSRYRAVANRADREIVFKAFWDNYKKFEASFGEMLYGNVKAHIFGSKARNYSSTLDAALYPNNIPVDVYHSLVDNVNKNLPAFHRYLAIKKRMMGVDTLKYLDLYAPVVKDVELTYSYDQAKELILKALNPLGSEYVSTVEKAFNERWIDVYPTTAKRSGAYSNGAAYDEHPYILLNYNDLYDDVSTLAHELGHTMHSYFSNKTQPYPTSRYTTFVAEVASTFNEVLLFDEMMKEIKDDDVRLSLLMEWLDGYKGTLFRQTQFAEYELKMHEAAEKGQPLTGDVLSKMYEDLVKKYYGHDKGICYIDDNISMEWAFIPHFYYRYYVYQYSTSFTASISLAERVINKEDGALEKYMKFISSGGSDYPIELLKNAGVDMTTSAPFDKTIESMNAIMDEIEKILDKKEKK
ncbi:MAG: oligoendopeptidase F [Bacteroidales bacterium]|nr:oligoendopeptidase F [Bacteroidales bacterium]